MSASVKKQTPPRMMQVMPDVIDPVMKSKRGQAEVLLSEMGGEQDDVKDTIFNSTNKTKEEQTASSVPSTDNTIMIVIFVLIIVALIAIIVWVIVKQGGDKKEEEEIKRRLRQSNPRNNMPQMHTMQRHNIRQDGMTEEQMYQQHMMQQQYLAQQQQQQQNQQPQQDKFSAALGIKDDKQKQAEMLASETEDENKNTKKNTKDKKNKKENFTKDNPHPNIIKPSNATSGQDESSVGLIKPNSKKVKNDENLDEVMQKASAALNNNALSADDKKLLDQLHKKDVGEEDSEDSEDGISEDEDDSAEARNDNNGE